MRTRPCRSRLLGVSVVDATNADKEEVVGRDNLWKSALVSFGVYHTNESDLLTDDRIWPVLACRLWELSPSSQATNPGSPNLPAQVLTQIAMETALNLASVTCLTPFLRPFQESGYIRSASQDGLVKYGITGANRSRNETYIMLGTAKSTTRAKDGSIVHMSTDKQPENLGLRDATGGTRLRADAGHHEAVVEREESGRDGAPQTGIRVSRSVNVQSQHGRSYVGFHLTDSNLL